LPIAGALIDRYGWNVCYPTDATLGFRGVVHDIGCDPEAAKLMRQVAISG